MEIRKLQVNDYEKYLNLLEQLTTLNKENISKEIFEDYIENILNDDHITYVMIYEEELIGAGTIFFEHKVIHGMGIVGHIEDVIISNKYRSKGVGKEIMNYLVTEAENRNSYKVILNCNETNCGFYEKCGFKLKEVEMVKYFI